MTASIGETVNLIPFFASDSASAEISRLIFNGLVKYDKNLKITGDLAESFEVLEDGMKIIFHLRKNVRWQDGRPFTAADVEFTFKKLTDPALPTPYGGDFEKVKSLEVTDDFTVEVRYLEPFSPGLASWGMGIVPKHLLENENLTQTPFAKKPVGTGPYLIHKWKSGELIELKANPLYFEGRPFIERYLYRIIPDQSTQFLELETENLDTASLTPLQFTRQTDTPFFKKKYVKYRTPSFGYLYLGYNLRHPAFRDGRVRKAIGLAIPKQELLDVTLLGLGQVATGPFLPGSWANNPRVTASGYDPAGAKKLLAEAGWSEGKLSFTVLTNQGNEQRKMACEIIQNRLADVGVRMNIQVVEWGTFLREFIDKKKFDAVLLAWNLSYDPDLFDIFHSSKTRPGEFNFVSYANPEVDQLLEEGRRLFREEARAPVYHRIHELIAEDEPYTFLTVPDSLFVLHRRFRGPQLAPIGIGHNFTKWFVPKNEQRYKIRLAE